VYGSGKNQASRARPAPSEFPPAIWPQAVVLEGVFGWLGDLDSNQD
jgi:hypothetical protein